jgi:hypothetical protein
VPAFNQPMATILTLTVHLRHDQTPHGGSRMTAESVQSTETFFNDQILSLTPSPFAGSGTTLKVALGHGRDSIGIDIDSRNATSHWSQSACG